MHPTAPTSSERPPPSAEPTPSLPTPRSAPSSSAPPPSMDAMGATLQSPIAAGQPALFSPQLARPPRLLTPSSAARRRFPRNAAIVLGVAEALGIITSLGGSAASQVVNVVARVAAVLAVCSMATWLEQVIYNALLAKTRAKRVVLSTLLPAATMFLGPAVGTLVGLVAMEIFHDDGTMMLALILGALWLASAAAGSIVIVVLDVLISALIADFRSRIQAAVLSLLTLAVVSGVAIYAVGRWFADMLRNADAIDLSGSGLKINLGGAHDLTTDEMRILLEMPETAEFVGRLFLFIATVVLLPAILSACGKLADAVMERLNPLRDAFYEVSKGRLDVRVEEGGSRELYTICQGFNRMTASLGATLSDLDEKNRDLGALNRATSRFVPFQFLELLSKRSIKEIARGDQIELEISVLFCDIRGFTTLAEAMGPRTTFAFINRYLGHVEPEIHKEHGFINDIIGDGIMALFHRGADAALSAALGMLRAVDRFNAALTAEGAAPIRVGIGIHSGPLMLGTIGGQDRLSCTVVGDAANAAARVEGLTKLYGAHLLVSHATVARLTDASRHRMRELDRVQAKGKNEAMVLYEVLDGAEDPTSESKWLSREVFAEGIRLYRERAFDAAQRTFEACLLEAPRDQAAALYIERCRGYIVALPDADWNGVARMETK